MVVGEKTQSFCRFDFSSAWISGVGFENNIDKAPMRRVCVCVCVGVFWSWTHPPSHTISSHNCSTVNNTDHSSVCLALKSAETGMERFSVCSQSKCSLSLSLSLSLSHTHTHTHTHFDRLWLFPWQQYSIFGDQRWQLCLRVCVFDMCVFDTAVKSLLVNRDVAKIAKQGHLFWWNWHSCVTGGGTTFFTTYERGHRCWWSYSK